MYICPVSHRPSTLDYRLYPERRRVQKCLGLSLTVLSRVLYVFILADYIVLYEDGKAEVNKKSYMQ